MAIEKTIKNLQGLTANYSVISGIRTNFDLTIAVDVDSYVSKEIYDEEQIPVKENQKLRVQEKALEVAYKTIVDLRAKLEKNPEDTATKTNLERREASFKARREALDSAIILPVDDRRLFSQTVEIGYFTPITKEGVEERVSKLDIFTN